MPNVVFVAPFFLETTLRFVEGAAGLPGVRLALLSQEPASSLPDGLRRKLAAFIQVRQALDPDELARAVQAASRQLGPVERIVGVLEHLQEALAEVRTRLGVAGMNPETARNFRDKSRMKDVLRAAGVPCARHRLVSSSSQARGFLKEIGFPVVVKPNTGAGAQNTFRLDRPEDLQQYLAAFPPERMEALFEEFLSGEEHSFDSVSIAGRPVWHSISRYLPSPLDVLQNPWIQWCVLLPRRVDGPPYDPIREAAAQALSALGVGTALTHLEWFRRPDGSVAVSEVAARPPGAQFSTLISYAHDIDLYQAWPRLMVYGEFEQPERRYSVGAAFLRGLGRGKVRAIHGLDQAQKELGQLVIEACLPRPGQPHSAGYEGDGYVIVRHPETAVVEQALARFVRLIRVELVE